MQQLEITDEEKVNAPYSTAAAFNPLTNPNTHVPGHLWQSSFFFSLLNNGSKNYSSSTSPASLGDLWVLLSGLEERVPAPHGA